MSEKIPVRCLKILAVVWIVVVVVLLKLEQYVYDTFDYDVMILIGACLELWTLVQLKRRKVFD